MIYENAQQQILFSQHSWLASYGRRVSPQSMAEFFFFFLLDLILLIRHERETGLLFCGFCFGLQMRDVTGGKRFATPLRSVLRRLAC